MTKDEAIREAAAATLAHGGPLTLTDPHISLNLVGEAIELGATHKDIENEMKRQRNAA
ncbi:hypothetical protein KCMC57_65210 (plasmid) [Kitasatospora sp. CMC57]|uniref:Antitoxin VbhA domain-containing protein n=1 Tax=Kitasatospora sp. CMC57 TaxID=3231513 RepID=A0AB33K922_9ACTN